MKFLKGWLVGAFCAVMSTGASAITLADGGVGAFTLGGDVVVGSVTLHLDAHGTITLDIIDATHISVTVSLINSSTSTPASPAQNIRLTSWGFGMDPNATGVAFVDGGDGGMIDASLASIPSLSAIEVCAWGGNSCAGGSNGGILAGGSDTFVLNITGASFGSSITFDPLGAKWQTNLGSFEQACTENCGGPPVLIPEPQTLALLGMGLFGVAMFGRRKQLR